MKSTIEVAIAAFGAKAKSKLSNLAAKGQPEDQQRAPFETLLDQVADLCHFPQGSVDPVGESSISDLKTHFDYAVTVNNALIGFIELKAPDKGADPCKFKDLHNKARWEKLRSLPNLMDTDGNVLSLWQVGELTGSIISLVGNIETSGNKLEATAGLLGLHTLRGVISRRQCHTFPLLRWNRCGSSRQSWPHKRRNKMNSSKTV